MACRLGCAGLLLDFAECIDEVAKCRVGPYDFHLNLEEVIEGGVNISCGSDKGFLSTGAADVWDIESRRVMVCEFPLV